MATQWQIAFRGTIGAQAVVTDAPFVKFSAATDDPSDFSCFGAMAFRRGRFEHHLNFYSVDHAPNPIILMGLVDLGLGLGLGWTPGRYKCFSSLQIRTDDVVTKPLALIDSDELSEAIADSTDSLAESNTDPAWIV